MDREFYEIEAYHFFEGFCLHVGDFGIEIETIALTDSPVVATVLTMASSRQN